MNEEKKGCARSKRERRMMAIAAIATPLVLGYAIGRVKTSNQFSRGLAQLCYADPTLETHMWNTIKKVEANK